MVCARTVNETGDSGRHRDSPRHHVLRSVTPLSLDRRDAYHAELGRQQQLLAWTFDLKRSIPDCARCNGAVIVYIVTSCLPPVTRLPESISCCCAAASARAT